MRKFLLFSVVFFMTLHAGAQSLSNLRSRPLGTDVDSVLIDTLSLVPNSFYLINSKKPTRRYIRIWN
ncbi:MAG: hypothetical protein IPF81_06850 [Bacteroidetes bacterium]|nr:hypothetical protein [Bacteroidota bacterium]